MNAIAARQAAALLAVDAAGLGGVALRDRHGPRREAWLAWLAAGQPPETPWRRMPASIDTARLLGGLDLTASLRSGRPVAQRGLLAECDGGVLLLPMAERLDRGRAALLGHALDTHQVAVQREGLDQCLPACWALVAMDEGAEPDETLPPALAERLGLWLDLGACGEALDAPVGDEAAAWRQRVQAAHTALPWIQVSDEALQALAETAAALGVGSDRALLQAWRAARAAAAWAGHAQVQDEDLAWAARLVLAPRATQLPPLPADDTEETPAEPPPQDACADTPPPADTSDPAPSDQALEQAADVLLQAALAALPPGLLARLAAGRARNASRSAGSAGAWQVQPLRGRPAGARPGDPRRGARLNLVETLRAAAPWQTLRRRERPATPNRVQLQREDFRITRRIQQRQTVTMFVVDASGSAAAHRLAEAKGAVELLLAECYVRRDQVALLAFRGQPGGPSVEWLLPPTRALARARRCLAGLVGGGATPLAAALDAAFLASQEQLRRGATPVVVVLSDGRANLARDGSPGRTQAAADALVSARAFAGQSLDLLWLDTAPQPQAQARELAQAMGARYLPLPHADARQLHAALG